MMERFAEFPSAARVWVYGLDRTLSEGDAGRVREVLDDFVAQWTSHGAPVVGAYNLFENRILVIAGYCADGISGCSTDSSVRVVRSLEDRFGVRGLDGSLVFYRGPEGTIDALPRTEFQRRVDAGDVGDDTVVFDTTVQTIADLRSGLFEITFARSWHARAFPRTRSTQR